MTTDSKLMAGFLQREKAVKYEITHREAHSRAVAGLPFEVEETRDQHGHPVFKYFIVRSHESP